MRRVVLESGIDNEADWLLQALRVLLCWFAVCHEQGQFQQLMSSLCCASFPTNRVETLSIVGRFVG